LLVASAGAWLLYLTTGAPLVLLQAMIVVAPIAAVLAWFVVYNIFGVSLQQPQPFGFTKRKWTFEERMTGWVR
jgi:hypothetical protein